MDTRRRHGFFICLAAASLVLLAALACAQPPAAPGSPRPGGAIDLLNQYKPDPGRAASLRAQREQPPPEGADAAALAKFYWDRSHAAAASGAIAQQIADLTRTVELSSGAAAMFPLRELASAQQNAGNYQQCIESIQRSISLIDEFQGARIHALSILINVQLKLGDIAAAQASLTEAEKVFERQKARRNRNRSQFDISEEGWLGSLNRSRALIAWAKGHLPQAEDLLRTCLANTEENRANQARKRERGRYSGTDDMIQNSRDSTLSLLADAQRLQGKTVEAEATLREALAATLSRVGRDSFVTAHQCLSFARLLNDTGRPAEAEALARETLAILDRIGAVPEARLYAEARMSLALSRAARRQWPEALQTFDELMAKLASAPELARQYRLGNITWAQALVETGQTRQAREMLEKLIAQSEQWHGKHSYHTAELRGMLGLALARAGAADQALSELRQAIPDLLNTAAEQEPLPSRLRLRSGIIVQAISLLAAPGVKPSAAGNEPPVAEAFRLADSVRGLTTQSAVSAAAARNAAGSPQLAALVRDEQDMRQEAETLRRALVGMLSKPPEQQSAQAIADLRKRIDTLDKDRKRLGETLRKDFPAYAELIKPKPLPLAQVQAVLRPGESLVSILSTEQGSFSWAVRQSGEPVFARSELTSAQVQALVKRLRAALDPQDGDLGRAPAFDLAAANQLYKDLLEPVAAGWRGSANLLAVTGGALSQLPLALLVTEPVQVQRAAVPYAEYRPVPWLIRQIAVTHLPSVNILATLRHEQHPAQKHPTFLGIGDPDFGGAAPVAIVAEKRGIRLRNLTKNRSLRSAEFSANGTDPVSFAEYASLPPLPDTREEILAIASALGADPKTDVLLGRNASLDALLAQDLTRRSILAFATHGLVPGDLTGLEQPALALASPGPGKTGLLTLEDILGLKLNTDWVVLSACNTAAGDGAGAEAISGLGRAFFYAGSRSLLVTHWPVETISARRLVTGIFANLVDGQGLSRAESLRRSMLALMDSPGAQNASGKVQYSYAHPIFWAPYALVGDDGAR